MSTREEQFEKMLSSILSEYEDVLSKMEKLRAANKVKTVTYKQLMATKLTLQNMISRYEIYGLLDKKQQVLSRVFAQRHFQQENTALVKNRKFSTQVTQPVL